MNIYVCIAYTTYIVIYLLSYTISNFFILFYFITKQQSRNVEKRSGSVYTFEYTLNKKQWKCSIHILPNTEYYFF